MSTTSDPSITIESAVKKKHPGRWIAAGLVLLGLAQVVYLLFITPGFGWDVVATYLFEKSVMDGLVMTLTLTAIAMTMGLVLGVVLATFRISKNPVLSSFAAGYIWFFRGTPTLIQLIFFYNISALFPQLVIGLPFGGPSFVEVPTNAVVTAFMAAVLCLGLNEAALMAEIIRGGLLSVGHGQREAGEAIGMSSRRILMRIIIPQAMRFIVPPTGNEVISMVKNTALVSVIALSDLLYSVQAIYNRTFETIPMLIVACIWYLILTSLLNVGQHFIERHYGKSDRNQRPSQWKEMVNRVKILRAKVTKEAAR